MSFKLTTLHKKILAGVGLVVGMPLWIGGLLVEWKGLIWKNADVPNIISLLSRLDYLDLILWCVGMYLTLFCGKFLYTAIFKPEKLRQAELENNDERNQIIRGKAAYPAFIVSMVIIALFSIGIYYYIDNEYIKFFAFVPIVVPALVFSRAKFNAEEKM